jgi:hypothetical protein
MNVDFVDIFLTSGDKKLCTLFICMLQGSRFGLSFRYFLHFMQTLNFILQQRHKRLQYMFRLRHTETSTSTSACIDCCYRNYDLYGRLISMSSVKIPRMFHEYLQRNSSFPLLMYVVQSCQHWEMFIRTWSILRSFFVSVFPLIFICPVFFNLLNWFLIHESLLKWNFRRYYCCIWTKLFDW